MNSLGEKHWKAPEEAGAADASLTELTSRWTRVRRKEGRRKVLMLLPQAERALAGRGSLSYSTGSVQCTVYSVQYSAQPDAVGSLAVARAPPL